MMRHAINALTLRGCASSQSFNARAKCGRLLMRAGGDGRWQEIIIGGGQVSKSHGSRAWLTWQMLSWMTPTDVA